MKVGVRDGPGRQSRACKPLRTRPNDVLNENMPRSLKRTRRRFIRNHAPQQSLRSPGLGRPDGWRAADMTPSLPGDARLVDDSSNIYAKCELVQRRVRLTRLALKGPLDIRTAHRFFFFFFYDVTAMGNPPKPVSKQSRQIPPVRTIMRLHDMTSSSSTPNCFDFVEGHETGKPATSAKACG